MIRLLIRLVGCYSLVSIISALYVVIHDNAQIDNILILALIMVVAWLSGEYAWHNEKKVTK